MITWVWPHVTEQARPPTHLYPFNAAKQQAAMGGIFSKKVAKHVSVGQTKNGFVFRHPRTVKIYWKIWRR